MPMEVPVVSATGLAVVPFLLCLLLCRRPSCTQRTTHCASRPAASAPNAAQRRFAFAAGDLEELVGSQTVATCMSRVKRGYPGGCAVPNWHDSATYEKKGTRRTVTTEASCRNKTIISLFLNQFNENCMLNQGCGRTDGIQKKRIKSFLPLQTLPILQHLRPQ